MLHLVPGASRKRVPPYPDVPSGNTLGSITRRSHKYPPAGSSRASPIFGFVVTRILRPQHATGQSGGGLRLPTVPLRSTAARLAATPTAKSSTPHFHHRVHSSRHDSSPPKNPHFNAARTRIENIHFFIGVHPSRYRLRALSASSVVLAAACAASSLHFLASAPPLRERFDSAPYGGKESLSFVLENKLRFIPRRAIRNFSAAKG